MIDFYSWDTPNGHKIRIMLEESDLEYRVHPVNLSAGEQFAPKFLAISPNNKIPAIVDPEGPGGEPISVFESGAILLYLAEKTGRLMPKDERSRWQVLEWLMFQMSAIGPMFGQLGHFLYFTPESVPYAVERYSSEAQRLATVVDRRLEGRDFLVGDYSIADIASFPWLARHGRLGIDLDELPNLSRWLDDIAARPAVQRGLGPIVNSPS
jgi:GST-like protein